ncbi:MAG: FtsX-like permease family protein [Gammaproteobacteria bacterium]|nr:FtsX-like permease family protein [Gammaproteobacteria bacterium]
MMALPFSRLLLRASLRHLLRQRWQTLLALVGVSLGVAVVLAVDLANHSARQAFIESAESLRGAATHRLVAGDAGIDRQLYVDLFREPGHPEMAPVISERVQVDGHPGKLRFVGLDLFAEKPFRSTLDDALDDSWSPSSWLTATDAVVLSRSAAARLGVVVGDPLRVRHQDRDSALRVVAIHPEQSLGSSDILVVDIATAEAVTGQGGRLSHIDLILAGAAIDWIRDRLPANVSLVETAGQIEGIGGMSRAFELNLTAMSLLALLVGMFLIFNASSFAIVQRRNLFGRLRALGVTPAQLYLAVILEALVLGLIGTLCGLLAGYWLAHGLLGIVASTISALYYEVHADAVRLDLLLILKAIALGLLATLVAVLLPARYAAATPPLTTLSRSSLEVSAGRLVRLAGALGLVMVVAGLLTAHLLPGGVITGFAGLFVVLLGAAMLTPGALSLACRVLRRVPLTGVWRMAARDLGRHLSRLSTAAAALMVALAASIGVAVMIGSMRGAVDHWLDNLLSADLYIAAEDYVDHAPLPPEVVAAAAQLPETAAISRYRSAEVSHRNRPLRIVASELAGPSRAGFELLAGRDTAWQRFDAGGLLISEPFANRNALVPGDSIELDTPDGPREFSVAGVFRDYASEHGRLFMPLETYRIVWKDQQIDTLALFARGHDVTALFDRVSQRLTGQHALVVTAADEIHTESLQVFDRTFRITEVLRYLSLVVAVVGILSALMAIQLERRREYAVMRALGMTRAQISRLIIVQSLFVGLVAGLVALPTGLLLAWVLTDVIQLRAFGWSMPFEVATMPLLTSLVLGIIAAMAAGLYPAWRSARQDPAPQLREEA